MEFVDISRIHETLKSFGMSNNEIKVYIDLLKYPKSTVKDISRRTNIHRTNIYDSLKNLKAKNLINNQINAKKSTYSSTSPDNLIKFNQNLKKNLISIIPILNIVALTDNKNDVATMSYGLAGLKKNFKTMMKEANNIKIFNAPSNILEILGKEFMKDFHNWREKNNLNLKVIYSRECERSKIAKKFLKSNVKVFPGNNESLCPYVLSGKRIFFLMLTEPTTIIEIENKKIADTFEKNFDFVWSKLKE